MAVKEKLQAAIACMALACSTQVLAISTAAVPVSSLRSEKDQSQTRQQEVEECSRNAKVSKELATRVIDFGGYSFSEMGDVCRFFTEVSKQNTSVSFSKSSVQPGETLTMKLKNDKGVLNIHLVLTQQGLLQPTKAEIDGRRVEVISASDAHNVMASTTWMIN